MPFDLYGMEQGLKTVDLPDRPVIHNTTLLATTDYIKANEENVYAFIKGFIEAVHFFKTQPNKVVPILKRNLASRYGLEDHRYYQHLQREWARLLSKKPYPLASAIQNVYDLDVGKDPACNISVRWSRGIFITCAPSTTAGSSISSMQRKSAPVRESDHRGFSL